MTNHQLIQQIDAILASHGSWHRETAIEIRRAKPGSIADDLAGPKRKCFFRDLLDSNTFPDAIRRSEPFNLVRWLHGECDRMMQQIVNLVRDGRKDEAIDLLDGHCEGLRGTFEQALIAWRQQVVTRKTAPLFE